MDEWTNRIIDAKRYGPMDEVENRCIGEWVNGRIDECIDEWTNAHTN